MDWLPFVALVVALVLGTEAEELKVVRNGANKGQAKHVGCYYGVWAYTRPGLGEFWPEDIDVDLCDVIYYGFGNVLNGTYEVCTWDPWFDLGPSDFGEQTIKNCVVERDGDAWPPGCVTTGGLEYCHHDGIRRTIDLKKKNPDLKVLYSVGGWTAGGWIFSDMAKSKESRQTFVRSSVHFMQYFGLDGIDLDWEYPAAPGFDNDPDHEPNPEDKQHFTLLMKEMRAAYDHHDPPYLITFAGAADPAKVDNAFELELIAPYIDWINIMSYDYHGAFDNYTGIDQPLYGKWEEGFQGHPSYQFNMHETVQRYLRGIPAEKLAIGIHTEGKGWILAENATDENCPGENCPAGLYCPAPLGTPNMTYSRQEGWFFYYELLQFFYNDTIPDTELPTHWPDLKPGLEHWTIYDHQPHENPQDPHEQDGCYMSPYAYQNRYWISYDDEISADLKTRYGNHYGLKGAFVWEVDTDNFLGMFNKRKYTILSAISDALVKGDGLSAEETLGFGWENKGRCTPEVPMCDTWNDVTTPNGTILPVTTPHTTPECTEDIDCNDNDSVICKPDYSNCHYCKDGACLNGCSENINCGDDMVCADHECIDDLGVPFVTTITVKTKSCPGCSSGNVEQGLKVQLTGLLGLAECETDNLDNPEHKDYASGATAIFDDKAGLGACEIDLFQSVESARASWTGSGTWTPESEDSVCVDFVGDTSPRCCCSLGQALTSDDGFKPLSNCQCH